MTTDNPHQQPNPGYEMAKLGKMRPYNAKSRRAIITVGDGVPVGCVYRYPDAYWVDLYSRPDIAGAFDVSEYGSIHKAYAAAKRFVEAL